MGKSFATSAAWVVRSIRNCAVYWTFHICSETGCIHLFDYRLALLVGAAVGELVGADRGKFRNALRP